jgi:hypothetical protein
MTPLAIARSHEPVEVPVEHFSPGGAVRLVHGQRLTLEEFMERWEQIPSLKKAELIEGVVYLPSPVSNPHSDTDSLMQGWAVLYASATPGLRFDPAALFRHDLGALPRTLRIGIRDRGRARRLQKP